jgi:hypothetical protein
MRHEVAEKKVRGLQKEFLTRVEHHPVLFQMEPDDFNDLRKRVFRGTFEAYRLGVVGLDKSDVPLWVFFFGWLDNHDAIQSLEPTVRMEVTEMCFRTALEAYRIGAMVAVERLIHDTV